MIPRRSPAEPPDPEGLEQAWPELLTPRDPWAGDERLPDPAAYEDLVLHGTTAMSKRDFARWDAAFLDRYGAVLDGRAPWGATDAAARALSLDGERRHDKRPPREAPERVLDEVLCDITEDWLPELDPMLERVLGPFAAEPLPRRLRQSAAAVLGKIPHMRHGVRPLDRVNTERPRPTPELRAAVRAVNAAAAMLYAVEGDRIRPLLPLARRHVPEGPIIGLPAAPFVIGLAIPNPGWTAWWLACALPLPACPDLRVILRRLGLEEQRLRRHDRRLTWEDLLCDRPEVLYRTACEWSWIHTGPDRVLERWSSAWA